jgi:hypothetical protein
MQADWSPFSMTSCSYSERSLFAVHGVASAFWTIILVWSLGSARAQVIPPTVVAGAAFEVASIKPSAAVEMLIVDRAEKPSGN